MKKVLALLVLFLIVLLNAAQVEAASARRMPTAYVVHTYGGATRDYQEGELSTWESLTDINCTAVTTTDQNSSGTTLYVADTTVFENCERGRSTVSVDEQVLIIKDVAVGNYLVVSPIDGTIPSGTDVKAGFVLECYADQASYDDSVVLQSATTDSNFFRVIKAADGEAHNGTPYTGVRFISTVTASSGIKIFFNCYENNTHIYDIVVNATSTAADAEVEGFRATLRANNVFVGCIAYNMTSTGGGVDGARGFYVRDASETVFINCMAINVENTWPFGTSGFFLRSTQGSQLNAYVYNCVAVDCSDSGFTVLATAGSGMTAYVKNTISQNNGVAFKLRGEGGTETYDETTCATSGVSFEEAVDYDFHLAAGDATAKNQGTDLSGDGVYPFDDDIDGQTRGGTWDIGIDEYGLLAAPTGVSATEGTSTDTVTISWNAVGSATGYEVWRNTTNDSASATRIANGETSTSYDDSPPTRGTYYYWVKTKNAEGSSEFSSSDSGYAKNYAVAIMPGVSIGRNVLIKT